MARIATLALVLLATVALAYGSAMETVDLSHDFLDVDPMLNEYAQLSEQGIAFTELGAEVEVDTQAEAEDFVETEADAEAQAESEMEAEAEETNTPVKAATPAPVPVVAKPATPAPAPVKAATGAVVPPAKTSQAGWTFKERAAPESVNSTDLYSLAYDRFKTCKWAAVNVSAKFPIKEFTYVLVSGPQMRKGYFEPIEKALANYGVPKTSIIRPAINWNVNSNTSAEALFKSLNNTFYNVLKEQRMVIIAHSAGIIPVHAMLTGNNTSASIVHGVIAINPIWGGTYLAENAQGLPADVSKTFKEVGLPSQVIAESTYTARQKAVRGFPLDYNSFRAMVIATHIEKSKEWDATIGYLKKYSKEINDGVVALSDQIIPGGRAIIIGNMDHDDLVYPTEKNAATDSVMAAQSYIYSFFKATP